MDAAGPVGTSEILELNKASIIRRAPARPPHPRSRLLPLLQHPQPPPPSIPPIRSAPQWSHENENEDDEEINSDPREVRRARAGGAAASLMQKRHHPHLAAAATASASPSSSSGGGGSGFGFCFNDIMELDAGSG